MEFSAIKEWEVATGITIEPWIKGQCVQRTGCETKIKQKVEVGGEFF